MSTFEPPIDLTWGEARNAGHSILHAALNPELEDKAHRDHLTVQETSALLGIEEAEVLKLIEQKLLCAQKVATTGGWSIERQCALTQQSAFMTMQREAQTEPSPQVDELFQATLDMTPALTEQPEMMAPPALTPRKSNGFASLNRHDATAKSVESILDSLDFANVRLEGAMYRIGYLEAQVDSLQEQLKVLPEFRGRAAKAILIERDNDNLKETLTAQEQELAETHKVLEKIQQNKAFRFWAWALGIKLAP